MEDLIFRIVPTLAYETETEIAAKIMAESGNTWSPEEIWLAYNAALVYVKFRSEEKC